MAITIWNILRAAGMGASLLLWLGLSACGSSGDSSNPAPALPAAIAPAVTIVSPAQNATLPPGPTTVSFTVQNFTIGGVGEPHLRFHVDNDPIPYDFLNGTTNQVHYSGVPAANVERENSTGMRLTNLAIGAHQIHFKLVDKTGADLTNPQSMTLLVFSVGVPSNSPSTISVSPFPGATFPPGAVAVSLVTANFSIGLQGQPHIHFFLNDDPTPYEFFRGPNEDTGVLYQGQHTHVVHWKTSNSFHILQQPTGTHRVRLELVDKADKPLGNPESTQTISFTIAEPPGGELLLEPVLSGLNFPVSMAMAPDGRVFYNEHQTGNVRIVDTAGGTWNLLPDFFYHVDVAQAGEQGLLGIVLDPNFSTNHYVYIYYVTSDGTHNRLIRLEEVNNLGTQPTVIIETPQAGVIHNGGILRFGPKDGKLYVTIGEWDQRDFAQNNNSLAGKILRLNADGSIPAGNPFGNSRIYARGLRNTFGMVFHPQTGHLWVTENGPDRDDEVNRIVAGGNYGWPIVTGIANDSRFLDPIVAITPPIGITGIVTIPQNSLYPETFHNDLLFAEVNGGTLHRIVLAGDHLGAVTVAFKGGVGPLLDIIQGPGGYLYTSSLSTIYRVIPNP